MLRTVACGKTVFLFRAFVGIGCNSGIFPAQSGDSGKQKTGIRIVSFFRNLSANRSRRYLRLFFSTSFRYASYARYNRQVSSPPTRTPSGSLKTPGYW